ncbi:hypothetical protein ACFVUH_23470 [Kitasatospora sp. NPDC058032]|uniref:hypothetical protein n=1 Tax=Kitasatospora sp. NPDC058032 TaxID=3346307 RepID=UPI0036DD070A
MAATYGPLRYETGGAYLGRGERTTGVPVFDRDGLRQEGTEGFRWDEIKEMDVEVQDIGSKSLAQNIAMFLLTVGSVTQRAPGTEESWLWLQPVHGKPMVWKFDVPKRSEARWSPGAVRRFVRRLDKTGKQAHLGSPELAASLEALHRVPHFPPWKRDRAVDRLVDALPAPEPGLGRARG